MKKFNLALVAAAVAILLPEVAFATELKTMLTSTASNIGSAVNLITYAAYIIGAMFILTGLLKLRAHVDNPGQNPLKDALGRLVVGALLGVTPFVIDTLRATTQSTTGTGTFENLNVEALT